MEIVLFLWMAYGIKVDFTLYHWKPELKWLHVLQSQQSGEFQYGVMTTEAQGHEKCRQLS